MACDAEESALNPKMLHSRAYRNGVWKDCLDFSLLLLTIASSMSALNVKSTQSP